MKTQTAQAEVRARAEVADRITLISMRFDSAAADAETWYRRAVEFYRDDIEAAAGKPVPAFHISSGFTVAGGRDTKVAGQCFPNEASADGLAHIFLNPRFVEPLALLNTVIHEVIHAAIGCEHGHRARFSRVAAACGMAKPWKATTWIDGAGKEKAELVAQALGPFPRAAFVAQGLKKQGARMLKAVCPECGYTVRLAKKWASRALPICGVCFCDGDGEPVALELA